MTENFNDPICIMKLKGYFQFTKMNSSNLILVIVLLFTNFVELITFSFLSIEQNATR